MPFNRIKEDRRIFFSFVRCHWVWFCIKMLVFCRSAVSALRTSKFRTHTHNRSVRFFCYLPNIWATPIKWEKRVGGKVLSNVDIDQAHTKIKWYYGKWNKLGDEVKVYVRRRKGDKNNGDLIRTRSMQRFREKEGPKAKKISQDGSVDEPSHVSKFTDKKNHWNVMNVKEFTIQIVFFLVPWILFSFLVIVDSLVTAT